MKTTTLLVLAAGIGSRFGGIKQLETVADNGETILDYSIYDAVEAGFEKIVFIVNRSILDDFKRIFEPRLPHLNDVTFLCQDIESDIRKKPWGTADAVFTGRNVIDENFCMINADDYYGKGAFRIISKHLQPPEEPEFSMVGYRLDRTLSSHGSVSRGQCSVNNQGFLNSVVERTGILSENGEISCNKIEEIYPALNADSIVSMNFWGFTPSIFGFLEERFEVFLSRFGSDPAAEFYINDVVNWSLQKNRSRVRVFEAEDDWMGITYREDKAEVSRRLLEMRQNGLYPERLW